MNMFSNISEGAALIHQGATKNISSLKDFYDLTYFESSSIEIYISFALGNSLLVLSLFLRIMSQRSALGMACFSFLVKGVPYYGGP